MECHLLVEFTLVQSPVLVVGLDEEPVVFGEVFVGGDDFLQAFILNLGQCKQLISLPHLGDLLLAPVAVLLPRPLQGQVVVGPQHRVEDTEQDHSNLGTHLQLIHCII